MSRPLRIQYPDAWYHVMNRGRRGEVIFSQRVDYYLFIDLLKDMVDLYNARIVAYCLMPNHYHILFQTPDANLSRCMRHLNGIYTQRFNRTHSSDGQLFRGRYKSILVDADSYLLELVRYIHRNPLESGMVDNLSRYTWSSHRAYLSGSKKWNWLYKGYILSFFSRNKAESIKEYKRFVSQGTPDEINRILLRKKLPSVLGSDGFVDKIKQRFFHQGYHEEIPESKALAPEVGIIKKVVCEAYNVKEKDLLKSKRGTYNEPRNVAIYLVRRIRGDSLKDIGVEFGMKKYSSVSSVIERMKGELSKNSNMRKRVEKYETSIRKSQEQT